MILWDNAITACFTHVWSLYYQTMTESGPDILQHSGLDLPNLATDRRYCLKDLRYFVLSYFKSVDLPESCVHYLSRAYFLSRLCPRGEALKQFRLFPARRPWLHACCVCSIAVWERCPPPVLKGFDDGHSLWPWLLTTWPSTFSCSRVTWSVPALILDILPLGICSSSRAMRCRYECITVITTAGTGGRRNSMMINRIADYLKRDTWTMPMSEDHAWSRN